MFKGAVAPRQHLYLRVSLPSQPLGAQWALVLHPCGIYRKCPWQRRLRKEERNARWEAEEIQGELFFSPVSLQKRDLFNISTRIPFNLSWGPGLLPSNFVSALLGPRSHSQMQRCTGPTSCCSLFHTGESFGSLGSAPVTPGCHTPAD